VWDLEAEASAAVEVAGLAVAVQQVAAEPVAHGNYGSLIMAHEHIVFPQSAKDAFPKSALERIAQTIAEVEANTSAEIRLSIRESRDSSESELTIQELAMKEFGGLKMHETAGRTGILLLLLFDERKFYIYGDQGINAHVDPETWTDVAQVLQEHFRTAKFEEGVHQALRKIIPHVRTILPRATDDKNELGDEVVIR
jgi:uncharacterized membrane protein